MKIESATRWYPVFAGWVRILLGVAILVAAGYELVFGDRWERWLLAYVGFMLALDGVAQIRADFVIRGVIDDREIRFRTRKGNDTVIGRDAVVDTEVFRRSILLYCEGPEGIRSVSLPLRRFSRPDTVSLREIFAERYPQGGGP